MPKQSLEPLTDLTYLLPPHGVNVTLGGRVVGRAYPIVGGEEGTFSVEITDRKTMGLLRKGSMDGLEIPVGYRA